jgi:uncharacterized protein (DUF1697 family)
VNVAGAGKLPMTELKRICEDAGLKEVRTFIASGNVIFRTGSTEPRLKSELEKRLEAFAGKPVGVFLRTAGEMTKIVRDFPFKDVAKNRGVVIFLDRKPPEDALKQLSGQADEKVALGKREIYVAYGEQGIGRSRLKIPGATAGTARNINTVITLAEMATGLAKSQSAHNGDGPS